MRGLTLGATLTQIALPENRHNPASKFKTINLTVLTGMESVKHNAGKSSSS